MIGWTRNQFPKSQIEYTAEEDATACFPPVDFPPASAPRRGRARSSPTTVAAAVGVVSSQEEGRDDSSGCCILPRDLFSLSLSPTGHPCTPPHICMRTQEKDKLPYINRTISNM